MALHAAFRASSSPLLQRSLASIPFASTLTTLSSASTSPVTGNEPRNANSFLSEHSEASTAGREDGIGGGFSWSLRQCPRGGRRQLMTMVQVEDFNVLSGAAEAGQRVNIDAYDDKGFIVDGVHISGAIICLGNSTFRWNVSSLAEVTPDSLAIFEAVRPVPEILVVGCGSHMVPIKKEVQSFLRKHGIRVEPEATANAAGTFNVLNEEGRKVAVALLPAS